MKSYTAISVTNILSDEKDNQQPKPSTTVTTTTLNISRNLIAAFKETIEDYCSKFTPTLSSSLSRKLGTDLGDGGIGEIKKNATRLNELEKKYGDSEIPEDEILACLFSNREDFSIDMEECLIQFKRRMVK